MLVVQSKRQCVVERSRSTTVCATSFWAAENTRQRGRDRFSQGEATRPRDRAELLMRTHKDEKP